MKAIRTVKKADGTTENMTYNDCCHRLGINPDCHFVDITSRGTIQWTCGKPEEIKHLRAAVEAAGMVPSKKLREF